jgi:hypothetical protein
MDKLRVFPIANEEVVKTNYTFTNAGYLADVKYEANSPYGILTASLDLSSFTSEYGVTTDAEAFTYLVTDSSSCSGVELVEDVEFNSPFGVLSTMTDPVRVVGFHGDEMLGITVGIDDYSVTKDYGVVTNLYDPEIGQEVFNSAYGIITSISETAGKISIWYNKCPDELTTLESEVEIPSMFDIAMKHYIVAHAFDDDLDTKYAEKSSKAFLYYERELGVIRNTTARGATQAAQYGNNYKGFM